MEATIRQVQDVDCEDLARFFVANCRPEITRHFHPFPLTSQTAHQIACTSHLDRYYIAIQDGEIIGLCMLRGWDEGYDIPSFGVFVDYRHQGHGVGRQMTEHAISEARKLNCSAIRLSVYTSNEHAVQLYGSLGFREANRETVIIAGQPDVKIILIRNLE